MAGTKLNGDTTVGFLTCGELEFCTKEYMDKRKVRIYFFAESCCYTVVFGYSL